MCRARKALSNDVSIFVFNKNPAFSGVDTANYSRVNIQNPLARHSFSVTPLSHLLSLIAAWRNLIEGKGPFVSRRMNASTQSKSWCARVCVCVCVFVRSCVCEGDCSKWTWRHHDCVVLRFITYHCWVWHADRNRTHSFSVTIETRRAMLAVSDVCINRER